MSMIEGVGIEIFASNTLWCLVFGVFPCAEGELEKQVIEASLKDIPEHKIDNIFKITEIAKLITQRPDYSTSNVTEFTYALRQLIRYASNDEIVSSSLSELKDIYISFITSYYYESTTFGKKEEAIKALKLFRQEILNEDEDMKARLAEILSYKLLS